MDVKLIAIGNVLMGDDGVGIRVAEEINGELERAGISVIIGETDIQYCISKIHDGDFVFILDACIENGTTDEVIMKPLNGLNEFTKCFSQHGISLLSVLSIYCRNIDGCLIGIQVEGSCVEFNPGLSADMNQKLKNISKIVLNEIFKYKINA